MNGRMYHHIPHATSNSTKHAISYIVFGGNENQLIDGMSEQARGDMLEPFIIDLFRMFDDLENPYTSELRQVGRAITSNASATATPAVTIINEKTSCFHVSLLSNYQANCII